MVGRSKIPLRFMIQFTRTLVCWAMEETSGFKSFSEAEFTVYDA